jgi:hypothetical protein
MTIINRLVLSSMLIGSVLCHSAVADDSYSTDLVFQDYDGSICHDLDYNRGRVANFILNNKYGIGLDDIRLYCHIKDHRPITTDYNGNFCYDLKFNQINYENFELKIRPYLYQEIIQKCQE